MDERENSSRQSVDALLEELSEFCQSKFLSEDGLRAIIEKHGCAPNIIDDPNNDYKFFLQACRNQRITEEILRYLLEYFPNAVRYADERGRLPLHIICRNKNVTRGMVQLLIDAFPESIRREDNKGFMPLHKLCHNKNLNDELRLEILKLLLERCPESVQHVTRNRRIPLHFAAGDQSPEFCRILIEAYPGSERITSNLGRLPFHLACTFNNVATAKYFYQLYPGSIDVVDNRGRYPIHHAIMGIKLREDNLETAVEIVQFLLDCDPDVVLQKLQDAFPLYWACSKATDANTQRLNVYLKVIQILYDAHAEAIEDNNVTSDVGDFCAEVQTFINAQLTYARQAKDRTLMITRDENGQLPLHKALRDNVTLGSIKLLVKGNPSATSCDDNTGMIPLHVACQHNGSASIVEYLLDLNPSSLRARDLDDNTALHYACRDANNAIIALLLDKYGSMSVAKRNSHSQLPIDLLLENNELRDEESVEHTESIYRLLRACPETIMNSL